MASIHKEIPIEARPDEVWAAVRDFGAVHQRLAPGFVVDAHLDGDARIVTFANGTVARELLVDCDDTRRRLVYAAVSERVKQHSAAVQVVPDGEARTRLIWTPNFATSLSNCLPAKSPSELGAVGCEGNPRSFFVRLSGRRASSSTFPARGW